jgi:alginate O-acetyltransferase complex protein AlgJ
LTNQNETSSAELLAALLNLSEKINHSGFDVIKNIVDTDKYNKDVNGIIKSAYIHILNMYINSDCFDFSDAAIQKDFSDSNSYLPFPAGFKSSDGSSILGKEGFVFLTGGSNNVIQQYTPGLTDAEHLATRWRDLTRERISRLGDLGVKYLQMIIPEKISVLPQYFPGAIETPTKLLAKIESNLKESEAAGNQISAFEIFMSSQCTTEVYSRLDSHLTPIGSFKLLEYILSTYFDFEINSHRFTSAKRKLGDLSHRMTGYFCPETSFEVPSSEFSEFMNSAELVNEVTPLSGLKGTSQSWKNKNAPIDANIMVFGNSYFSHESKGQSALSWWFARYFREFHFVWTNEVEFEYVAERRPDVVLWQGVERFLPVLPAS